MFNSRKIVNRSFIDNKILVMATFFATMAANAIEEEKNIEKKDVVDNFSYSNSDMNSSYSAANEDKWFEDLDDSFENNFFFDEDFFDVGAKKEPTSSLNNEDNSNKKLKHHSSKSDDESQSDDSLKSSSLDLGIKKEEVTSIDVDNAAKPENKDNLVDSTKEKSSAEEDSNIVDSLLEQDETNKIDGKLLEDSNEFDSMNKSDVTTDSGSTTVSEDESKYENSSTESGSTNNNIKYNKDALDYALPPIVLDNDPIDSINNNTHDGLITIEKDKADKEDQDDFEDDFVSSCIQKLLDSGEIDEYTYTNKAQIKKGSSTLSTVLIDKLKKEDLKELKSVIVAYPNLDKFSRSAANNRIREIMLAGMSTDFRISVLKTELSGNDNLNMLKNALNEKQFKLLLFTKKSYEDLTDAEKDILIRSTMESSLIVDTSIVEKVKSKFVF